VKVERPARNQVRIAALRWNEEIKTDEKEREKGKMERDRRDRLEGINIP